MTARLLLTGALALVLASCATVSQDPDSSTLAERTSLYQARTDKLTSLEHWSMGGKLAISDGKDGGSGNLQWRSQPNLSELDFRGAFGRGAWQLDIRPGHAVLNFANGDTWEAPEVSGLVEAHVGWEIPVDALEWWIRGLAAPGDRAQFSLDDTGTLNRLEQFDWTVEYLRYREFSGIDMPTRIEASNGKRHVRFVVRDWGFSDQPAHDS